MGTPKTRRPRARDVRGRLPGAVRLRRPRRVLRLPGATATTSRDGTGRRESRDFAEAAEGRRHHRRGATAYEALPLGAMLEPDVRWGEFGHLVRVKDGFIRTTRPDEFHREGAFFDPRVIAYLPDSAA
jgi:hypothetical protein